MSKNIFRKRLIKLRKEARLSQYQLAEELNLSRGQIGNYEQGSRQPDYEILSMIAKYFDVSTDFLLGNSDIRNPEIYKIEDIHKALNIDPEMVSFLDNEANKDLIADIIELKNQGYTNEFLKELIKSIKLSTQEAKKKYRVIWAPNEKATAAKEELRKEWEEKLNDPNFTPPWEGDKD